MKTRARRNVTWLLGLILLAPAGLCAQGLGLFSRGDSNADGRFDISDPMHSLGYLFLGGYPMECGDAADANDSGDIDISDPIYALAYLFLGGLEPPSPFPECGPDPTDDRVSCDRYDAAPCHALLDSDSDGDGLPDALEEHGWEVWVDPFGLGLGFDTFGNITDRTRYEVGSDPDSPDGDGDGLTDLEEFLSKSDPAKTDTDGDGLTDAEEVHRWLTSPTSVDSDGDSRGPGEGRLAPQPALFDGLELFAADILTLPLDDSARVPRARATSPTLDDTDGDGSTDWEEYAVPGRSPVLADLPRLEVFPAGDVDVRLNIEYAESRGETVERGTTLGRSVGTTTGQSTSITNTASVQTTMTVGTEVGAFSFFGVESNFSLSLGYSFEHNFTTSSETTRESSEEISEVKSEAFEKSETFSTGSIRTSVRLKNTGNIAYRLTNLNMLAKRLNHDLEARGGLEGRDAFLPIGTLLPAVADFTLAPGEETPPVELSATELDGATIRELLEQPNSLAFETASADFETADGLNFDFVKEVTLTRTALLIIDFGDGVVERYYVATNVDREAEAGDDPAAGWRGITLGEALEKSIGLLPGDPQGFTVREVDGRNRLHCLRGRCAAIEQVDVTGDGSEDTVGNYWIAKSTIREEPVSGNVEDVVLRAGDQLLLAFLHDRDQDGVDDNLETAIGLSSVGADSADSDGDGLSDLFELATGWVVFDPVGMFADGSADGDGDGRFDEDGPAGIDDDGDGFTDEDVSDGFDNDGDGSTDEDGPTQVDNDGDGGGTSNEDPINGQDDDSDDLVDEDPPEGDNDLDGRINEDPINGRDDDGDGHLDEDGVEGDEDGDGKADEDPIDGVDNDADGRVDEDDSDDDRDGRVDEDPVTFGPLNPHGFRLRRVTSNPALDDSDGDSLSDAAEFEKRSDPRDPDTDKDGIPDGADPWPIWQARLVCVDASAPAGGTPSLCYPPYNPECAWSQAVRSLQDALALHAAGAGSGSPDDDVAEIWVADGVYRPDESAAANRMLSFKLGSNLRVFGGFRGRGPGADPFLGETKRSQRNPDPRTNGTVLSGDLKQDDTNETGELDPTKAARDHRTDNSQSLLAFTQDSNPTTVFDGFQVSGAYSDSHLVLDPQGAIHCAPGSSPVIRNLLIVDNLSTESGAGAYVLMASPTFNRCTFSGNFAPMGAAVSVLAVDAVEMPPFLSFGANRVRFQSCSFENNRAGPTVNSTNGNGWARGGGALIRGIGGEVDIVDCSFLSNRAVEGGAGLYVQGDLNPVEALFTGVLPITPTPSVVISGSRFIGNSAVPADPDGFGGFGGAITAFSPLTIVNSVLWDNEANLVGAGILAVGTATVVNCTVANNHIRQLMNAFNAAGISAWTFAFPGASFPQVNIGFATVQNCIIWNNDVSGAHATIEGLQLSGRLTVRNSCFNSPSVYRGNGNIGSDPTFQDLEFGDLRLSESSPCIDRGDNFVDTEPLEPGLQFLPALDLGGLPRVADGNGDGSAVVDMGAFEARPGGG